MQQLPKPQDSQMILNWFDSPRTWEIPHDTIRYDYKKLSMDPITLWYFQQRTLEMSIAIEKRVIFRTLPYYSKHISTKSKLFAVYMDPELWQYFVLILSTSVPPKYKSIKKFYLPDHGFRRREYHERVSWVDNLPRLYNHNWNYKKWIDTQTYNLWRARIKELHLTWNSYTHLVRVEFEYEMNIWRDEEKKWDDI